MILSFYLFHFKDVKEHRNWGITSGYWFHVADVPLHSETSASKTGSFIWTVAHQTQASALFNFCFNKSSSGLREQKWLGFSAKAVPPPAAGGYGSHLESTQVNICQDMSQPRGVPPRLISFQQDAMKCNSILTATWEGCLQLRAGRMSSLSPTPTFFLTRFYKYA